MIDRVGFKVGAVERDIGRLKGPFDVLHELGLIGDVGQRLAWQVVGFTRHPLPVRPPPPHISDVLKSRPGVVETIVRRDDPASNHALRALFDEDHVARFDDVTELPAHPGGSARGSFLGGFQCPEFLPHLCATLVASEISSTIKSQSRDALLTTRIPVLGPFAERHQPVARTILGGAVTGGGSSELDSLVTSPVVGVQFLDTSSKDAVHVIQTFGEPFMLLGPVRFVLRVHTIEVRRDPAGPLGW